MKHQAQRAVSQTLLAAGGAVLLCLFPPPPASGDDTQSLIELMLKKGMLTDEEAAQLRSEAAEQTKESRHHVRFYWKNGLNFESADGQTFRGKLGGRIELDVAGFIEDAAIRDNIGDQQAAIAFRRARLSLEGEFNTSAPVYYDFNLDFAGAQVEFKDMLVGLADLPVIGSLQIGHFKEPFSLEVLTSEKYNTFMERGLPLAPSVPARNTGVMIGRPILNDRMTWAVGSFAAVGDSGDGVLDSNYQVTGRLTGVPYQEDDRLLHLGIAGSFFSPQDDTVRLRAKPEAALADYFVNTDFFAAHYGYLVGLETALVFGPFSLQGEYIQLWFDSPDRPNPNFHGYYVYGSYFLTGESRVYKPSAGVFTRMKPTRNFSLQGDGPGAWELAVRYSAVDLNDAGIAGGRIQDVTGGVNWYLNPNTRMMFNYIYSQVEQSTFDGHAHIFMSRVQVDF